MLKNGLISSSIDGFIKIWDLNEQYCVQTTSTGGLGGEVWAMAVVPFNNNTDDDENKYNRWRLITGCNNIQIRFYDLSSHHHQQHINDEKQKTANDTRNAAATESMEFDP